MCFFSADLLEKDVYHVYLVGEASLYQAFTNSRDVYLDVYHVYLDVYHVYLDAGVF